MQARSRATTAAVLAAAAHILEEEGAAGFNTNAVAERAGVSIGSLYQYYPNKDAILVALIERQVDAFTQRLAEVAARASGRSFADDLRLLLSEAIALHHSSPRLSRALEAEEDRLRDDLDLQSVKSRSHATLETLMRRHGILPGETGGATAEQIGRMVKMLLEAEASSGTPDWPMATERAVGAVIGYLSVQAPGDASRLTLAPREA